MAVLQNDFLVLFEIANSILIRVVLHQYVPRAPSLSVCQRRPGLCGTLAPEHFDLRVDVLEEIGRVTRGHLGLDSRIVAT